MFCPECRESFGGQANHADHEGYITWSPKKLFEKSCRPADGLTFGMAIEAIKCGKKVARRGWNGKGMWLRLYSPYIDPEFPVREIVPFNGTPVDWIGMKTVDEKFVPWLASQTDMLAEDWNIL